MIREMPKKRASSGPDTPPRAPKSIRSSIPSDRTNEYFSRFRECNERNGRNKRGGGNENVTDAVIMQDLRAVASGEATDGCRGLWRFCIAYGVNRTFRDMKDAMKDPSKLAKLEPIRRHLTARWPELRGLGSTVGVAREVEDLMACCQAAGFGRNPSFASKCLCMLGVPCPIFSSEARAFLRAAEHKLRDDCKEPGEYASFCKAWMCEYDKHRARYEDAARCELEGDLEHELGEAWFAMRGFDVHVMAVGGPMRK